MAMGKRKAARQGELWIATGDLARSPGHPFYDRLNRVLAEGGFDPWVEERFAKFYADNVGRPGLAPGVYVRMLLVGYFEGLDSERGIAWRCADSLALRGFLGLTLSESPADHSTVSRTRRLIDAETHEEIFAFVLKLLTEHGLVKAEAVGIDASTLEANAAMKSIVRRKDGMSYRDFLVELAKASGIETPTQADLARIDRKRPGKGSNDDWQNPSDPDAQMTKMKDGTTHFAHKAEHAVDMDSGAVLAVTITPGATGDTTSMYGTMKATAENVARLRRDETLAHELSDALLVEWVADKGYHSNDTVSTIRKLGARSCIAEPERGKRRWKGDIETRDAVYANRRRIKSRRGRTLMHRRGEYIERSFAHCLVTGRMRRVYLRGCENIRKRYLVHVAASNLGLLMRTMCGVGTPRSLQGRLAAICIALQAVSAVARAIVAHISILRARFLQPARTVRVA